MMNHGDTEARRDGLTREIIGGCIDIHRALGPGLLESTCLCHERPQRRVSFLRQVSLPASCKSIKLDCGYRLDLLIENEVIVELKTVEKLLPIHEAQLLA